MKNLLIIFLMFGLFNCDSDDRDSILDTDLIGEWKLTSFVDQNENIILTEDDFENSNPINLNIENDSDFKGSTILNEFFGSYSINNSKTVMIFLNFNTSEANETEWGYLFYEKINLNYNLQTQNYENNYDLDENTLKLFYSEFEYMTFEKQ